MSLRDLNHKKWLVEAMAQAGGTVAKQIFAQKTVGICMEEFSTRERLDLSKAGVADLKPWEDEPNFSN